MVLGVECQGARGKGKCQGPSVKCRVPSVKCQGACFVCCVSYVALLLGTGSVTIGQEGGLCKGFPWFFSESFPQSYHQDSAPFFRPCGKFIAVVENRNLILLNTAEKFVRLGYRVYPVRKGGKEPIVKTRELKQMAPEETLERIKLYNLNEVDLGVFTPASVVVLDIDLKNVPETLAPCYEGLVQYLTEQCVLCYRTPSGGYHFHFSLSNEDFFELERRYRLADHVRQSGFSSEGTVGDYTEDQAENRDENQAEDQTANRTVSQTTSQQHQNHDPKYRMLSAFLAERTIYSQRALLGVDLCYLDRRAAIVAPSTNREFIDQRGLDAGRLSPAPLWVFFMRFLPPLKGQQAAFVPTVGPFLDSFIVLEGQRDNFVSDVVLKSLRQAVRSNARFWLTDPEKALVLTTLSVGSFTHPFLFEDTSLLDTKISCWRELYLYPILKSPVSSVPEVGGVGCVNGVNGGNGVVAGNDAANGGLDTTGMTDEEKIALFMSNNANGKAAKQLEKEVLVVISKILFEHVGVLSGVASGVLSGVGGGSGDLGADLNNIFYVFRADSNSKEYALVYSVDVVKQMAKNLLEDKLELRGRVGGIEVKKLVDQVIAHDLRPFRPPRGAGYYDGRFHFLTPAGDMLIFGAGPEEGGVIVERDVERLDVQKPRLANLTNVAIDDNWIAYLPTDSINLDRSLELERVFFDISGRNKDNFLLTAYLLGFALVNPFLHVASCALWLHDVVGSSSDGRGGTGKSFTAKCLRLFLPSVSIDGRSDLENRFVFSGVNHFTRLIVVQDYVESFGRLFVKITDDLVVDIKHKHPFTLPAQNVQWVFTSQKAPPVNDPAARRRVVPIDFSYSLLNSPDSIRRILGVEGDVLAYLSTKGFETLAAFFIKCIWYFMANRHRFSAVHQYVHRGLLAKAEDIVAPTAVLSFLDEEIAKPVKKEGFVRMEKEDWAGFVQRLLELYPKRSRASEDLVGRVVSQYCNSRGIKYDRKRYTRTFALIENWQENKPDNSFPLPSDNGLFLVLAGKDVDAGLGGVGEGVVHTLF